MSRMLRAAAEAHLAAHAANVCHEQGVDPTRLSPGGIRHLTALAMPRLNRAARRALGERGDGRHHPLANARAIPRTRGR